MSLLSRNELFSKWSSTLGSARYRLLAIRRQEGFEEVKRKRIIIDKEVSRILYLKFCESEPRISVKYRLIEGKIEAYEMPLDPHALIQGELFHIMGNWSNRLRVLGELDVIVDAESVYRPDICVRPKNRHQPPSTLAVNSSGNPYPTLVVEVGDTESLNSLHNLAEKYFSQQTTIQIYLAVKLYPRRQDNTFALLAMLYLRNNQNPTTPVVVKSFGTAPLSRSSQIYLQNIIQAEAISGVGFGGVPCDGTNIAEYQIAIPSELIFNDVDGVDGVDGVQGVPNNFTIDLWRLKDAYINM
ncbi:9643_t:CDS:1 [Paraglomus brasilianum]|uniref:9643_t:CDS:1 n=1 Tax=Paraglomus brasilianum TaxID=144538 RepID=A0A9N9FIG3_9GLOM|nr:9643_t:CDS:1 [Paraglomus brasilianum]